MFGIILAASVVGLSVTLGVALMVNNYRRNKKERIISESQQNSPRAGGNGGTGGAMPSGSGPLSFADVAALAARIRAEKAAENKVAAAREEDESSPGTLRAGLSPTSALRASGGAAGLDSPVGSPMRNNPLWQFQMPVSTQPAGLDLDGQPLANGQHEHGTDIDGLSTIWEAGRRTYSQQQQ
jgi:hypothetical protein